MKTRMQIRRDARHLIRLCLVDGRLEENRVRRVLVSIRASGQRNRYAVLSDFLRLLKIEVDRRTATVESATPLTADMQGRLKTGLYQRYGQGLTISFLNNPALLGGVRIKIGCDVFDGSVKARLAALQAAF